MPWYKEHSRTYSYGGKRISEKQMACEKTFTKAIQLGLNTEHNQSSASQSAGMSSDGSGAFGPGAGELLVVLGR